MDTHKSFYAWTMCLALVFAAHIESANAASDRMLITGTGGAVVFDNSVPEGLPAGGETSLTFTGGPANVPPPVPPLSLIGTPGVSVVVLTEPASEPPDPTEPPLVIPGPTGPISVSDVVISSLGAGTVPPFISLLSDGDPELQQLTSLPAGTSILAETGQLQDLAGLLVTGTQFGPIDVQVQSDVVPEPGTLLLLGSGLAGLAAVGARRRHVWSSPESQSESDRPRLRSGRCHFCANTRGLATR